MAGVLQVILPLAIGLAASAPTSQAASAADNTSKTVYSAKAWEVRSVSWSDGSSACVAEVRAGDVSFSIWRDKKNPMRLQFYDKSWKFGDGSADMQMQIDDRKPWTLRNANLYKQSVLFDLPKTGTQLLSELVQGSKLHLGDDKGNILGTYSLSGSKESLDALTKCAEALH